MVPIVRNRTAIGNSSILLISAPGEPSVLSLPYPPRSAGIGTLKEKPNTMMNIVESYSAETALENDEGVVAIEYVVVSAAIVVALAACGAAFGTVADRQAQTRSSTASSA